MLRRKEGKGVGFNPKTAAGKTALIMCALEGVECPSIVIVDEVTAPQETRRR